MTDLTLEQAMDNVYAALKDDNRDLDEHVAALNSVLRRDGLKEAVFDPKRLAQSNRRGRKLMQSYFGKRGVEVSFAQERELPAPLRRSPPSGRVDYGPLLRAGVGRSPAPLFGATVPPISRFTAR